MHELAHIKRGDAFVFLLQRILQCVFFFNPFVWWANAIIDRLREYACDDAALAGSMSSPKECGEGFLGAVMQSNGLPTFMLASHGLINYNTMIKRRLVRILDNTRSIHTKITVLSKVLLLAFTLTIFPLSWNSAMAQVGEWIKIPGDPLNSPRSRCLHGMVYDSTRNVIVLHGGWEGPGDTGHALNDTWEWDVEKQKWSNVSNEGPKDAFSGWRMTRFVR